MQDKEDSKDEDCSDVCIVCGKSDVPRGDRWSFCLDEENTVSINGEGDQTCLCRECHSKFDSVDMLQQHIWDLHRWSMYRAASALQRGILLSLSENQGRMSKKLIGAIIHVILNHLLEPLFKCDCEGGSQEARSIAIKLFKKKYRNLKSRFE